MKTFERILLKEVLPLAKTLRIQCNGVWRTLVGNVGEYLELWEFKTVEEYHRKWTALLRHPELQKVFEITGPIVEDEKFALLEPVGEESVPSSESARFV
jgi:hypothetical protein